MFDEIIFDLETQRFFDEIDENDPSKLGVSIVSAYHRQLDQNFSQTKGQMFSFWEDELEKLWPLFQSADRIIGFNSIRFDVPVLQPYTPLPLTKFNHFDILDKVKESFGRRVRLDAITQDTLGTAKNDHGANAVRYWKTGDKKSLQKLQKYCEMDVTLTRDLYDHALKHGELKFTDRWNTPRVIKVDFSYPQTPPSSQTTLF